LMSSHLPNEAVVVRNAVQPFRETGHASGRDNVVDFPGLGINTDHGFQPIGIYPHFAGVRLPCHAVSGAAVVFGPERDLSMADLLAVHIGLEDPVNGRCRMLHLGSPVGLAPDVAGTEAHAAGVLAIRHYGVKELAFPIDQPCGFRLVIVALFLNPETSLLIVVDVDRIGPSGRREKQFGGLGHPLGNLLAVRRSANAAAEGVSARLTRRGLGGLPERRTGGEARAEAHTGTQYLSSPDTILQWHRFNVGGFAVVVNALPWSVPALLIGEIFQRLPGAEQFQILEEQVHGLFHPGGRVICTMRGQQHVIERIERMTGG